MSARESVGIAASRRPGEPTEPAGLTIGIPTYNRSRKLIRLLEALREDVTAAASRVRLFVSDNCSTDDTWEVVSAWAASHPTLRVTRVRQPENIGGGRNFRYLYDEALDPYVWLFGDDDIPARGALSRILRAIDLWEPDVLVGGFEQPPGSLLPVLPGGSADQLAEDPGTAARAICGMTKVTAYVYRTRVLPRCERDEDREAMNTGFPHCVMALSILDARKGGRAALLADAIAISDDDFACLRTPVSDWTAYERTLAHPFVARHAPDLAHSAKRAGFALLVDFLWGWRNGTYAVEESFEEGYWSALRGLRSRWRDALQTPRILPFFAVLVLEPVRLPGLVSRIRRLLAPRRRTGTAAAP
jgi:glycosyltransferase involved in cell wall biosynthesis